MSKPIPHDVAACEDCVAPIVTRGPPLDTEEHDAESPEKDLLMEWLELSRNVLARYYPGAEYGLLLIHVRDGTPDVQFPVTLPPPLPVPSVIVGAPSSAS
jgi:hypothetical protein